MKNAPNYWRLAAASLLLTASMTAAEYPPPNIEGYWNPEIGGTYSITNPSRGNVGLQRELGKPLPAHTSRVIDPPDGQIPYQPWARIKQQYIEANIENPVKPEFIDTQARCLPGGPIRATFWHTVHILQYPGYVVFEYEGSHLFRIVPLDGRAHVDRNLKLWMGDARGHWEGNTLVVDVTSYNGKSRLSNVGDFTSDKAHIVERYTFVDNNTLQYRATIEDPSVYTRPWTIASGFHRGHTKEQDYEQWEEACHEGERNVADSIVEDGK